jgi:hypothetical protein
MSVTNISGPSQVFQDTVKMSVGRGGSLCAAFVKDFPDSIRLLLGNPGAGVTR